MGTIQRLIVGDIIFALGLELKLTNMFPRQNMNYTLYIAKTLSMLEIFFAERC
jgi:hypothetical protein